MFLLTLFNIESAAKIANMIPINTLVWNHIGNNFLQSDSIPSNFILMVHPFMAYADSRF